MLSGVEKIILVLGAGEFLLGILGNGFMVLVNGIDWIRNKKLAIGDIILVCLAISRIGLLCSLIWTNVLLVLYLDELLTNKIEFLGIFWMLTYLSSVWFATCLSVFYFLKTANFSHPLFLWLKWRINNVVFMLQVGPLPFSLPINLPLWMKSISYSINKGNSTEVLQKYQIRGSQYFTIYVTMDLLDLIPFILSLVSFLFLILSLWRHTHQMKLNATGSKDPSTEAHVRAMKSIFSFLILFVLFYLGKYISYWNYFIPNSRLAVILALPLLFLYPSGHSLVLILYNSKLRQAALKMRWQGFEMVKPRSILGTCSSSMSSGGSQSLCSGFWAVRIEQMSRPLLEHHLTWYRGAQAPSSWNGHEP
ncbi:taste receptor type 2 member 7-like [Trichosurus vulpecula]|uniref:taste receptor type 2 member 7-like n=1 Tax=Trichosurus vulpecula TaxID=9337 RepID=UPI00186AD309|nr:taste receptor type 2 member 7-like [Trichosurus vulpecula]